VEYKDDLATGVRELKYEMIDYHIKLNILTFVVLKNCKGKF
jgi:hypothetical protein